MRKTSHLLRTSHLLTLYYSLIYPYLDYGISVWGSTHISYLNTLFMKQKKAVRTVTGAKYNEHSNSLFKQLKLLKLNNLHQLKVSKYMYCLSKGTLPSPIIHIVTYNTNIHSHHTRNRDNPHIHARRTNIAAKSLRHKGPQIWYKLPNEIKTAKSLASFTNKFTKFIIESY